MTDFQFKNSTTVLFTLRTDAMMGRVDNFTILDIIDMGTDEELKMATQALRRGLTCTLQQLVTIATNNSLVLKSIVANTEAVPAAVARYTPTLPTVGTVTPTVDSATKVTCDWPDVVNATGYIIERATNVGFTTGVVAFTSTASVFQVTGLTTATQYWFRVRATATDYTTGANSATATETTS